jgi:hypothetical protein
VVGNTVDARLQLAGGTFTVAAIPEFMAIAEEQVET